MTAEAEAIPEVSANGHISVFDVRGWFEKAASAPRRIESVTVPGLGTVHVTSLRSNEFDEYEASCVDATATKAKANRAMLLRHCVVTPDGKKVFRDDHLEMLASLDSGIVNPIAKKCMELCGGSDEEIRALEKN